MSEYSWKRLLLVAFFTSWIASNILLFSELITWVTSFIGAALKYFGILLIAWFINRRKNKQQIPSITNRFQKSTSQIFMQNWKWIYLAIFVLVIFANILDTGFNSDVIINQIIYSFIIWISIVIVVTCDMKIFNYRKSACVDTAVAQLVDEE